MIANGDPLEDECSSLLVLVYPFELQSLREYAKEPLSQFEIQRVIYQILKGISTCHRAGVIHRNLKSDNIFVGEDGLVKIADFTSSRISSIPIGSYTPEDPKERDRSGREAKRLWYRAPELLYRARCYTFETDMWSIGCLLAEVARSIPLFNGQSEIESLFKIFKLTGSPEEEQLGSNEVKIVAPKWKRIPFTHILGQESEINELIEAFIPQRESAFTVLVELKHKLGQEGLDLLQRLLELDPRKRISAEQALRHKFFEEQRYMDCNQLPPLLVESYTVEKFGCTDAYIETSFDFLRKQDLQIGRKHISTNEQITTQMRMVLVDWLLDVSVHFDLKFETLHLAVLYVQRFLAWTSLAVDRANLQLVGVASMKIADAFNEKSREYYRQENALEYSNITAQEFTSEEVLNMEKCILSTLDFQLFQGTLISYVELFNQIIQPPKDDEHSKTFLLACFLSDLTLLSPKSDEFEVCSLALGAIVIALKASGAEPNPLAEQRCLSLLHRELVPQQPDNSLLAAPIKHILDIWHESHYSPEMRRFDAIYQKYIQYSETRNLR